MLKTRTVFHPASDQSGRIAALTSYARARGCRTYVDRPLNRPPGTKIVISNGSLAQIWRVFLVSQILRRRAAAHVFIGEFAI